MKKKAVSLLLSLLVLAAGTGCSSGGNAPAVESAEESASSGSESETEASEDDSQDTSDETLFGSNEEDAVSEASDTSAKSSDTRIRLAVTYFDQSRYTDKDRDLYFECSGDHILCTPDIKDAYPELTKALQDIADDEESYFADNLREYDSDALEYLKSTRSSGGEYHYMYYADDFLKRADDKCVSIVRIVNGYLGGAHPDYFYETFNIDTDTGDQIVLSDIISDQDRLNDILEQKLTADYPDVEYFGLKDSLAEYDMTITEDADDNDGDYKPAYLFTLDPDGISFYFSPYGISAYAYGDQVVKILYDEEPDLFKKDFSYDGPYVSYLTGLDNKYGIEDSVELIRVQKSDDDDNNYFQQIDIYKGDKELSLKDLYYFSLVSYIVHTDNGGDFVYVIANTDNDYKLFYAADLRGAAPSQITLDPDVNYCYGSYIDEKAGIYETLLPLYPDYMELGVSCDLLSTYSATGDYTVQDDGTLQLNEKYLTIPVDSLVLTSKMDLTADVVDEDGNVVEKDATIKKGSEYTLYRTDGKSIVDARIDDGRLVRLELSSEYPRTVNGEYDEESLFDGLMYAG